MEWKKSYKEKDCHNPLMTQRFGADPYALVYEGRVYLYMTGDVIQTNEQGKVISNTYQKIDTIQIISSADLVNWTDHGSVCAASGKGAAKWGRNSWAPAAAYCQIDGKDKFFLYFANGGNGIAVLTADSPTGPFVDPIGGPLVSRDTPNCADVTWLFDPAVLVDEDGRGYLYFGGGIPNEEAASNPQTARVARLGKDMISLDGDPVRIENVPYLFEDAGINKIGDTYYYSYCSNFNVPHEKEAALGYGCGEIVCMKSKDPMGPFEPCGSVLKNPEYFFQLGSNNHHCIFSFEGNYYMAYHTRLLEDAMGINGGYRSTNLDELKIKNGRPMPVTATKQGVKQVRNLNPYERQSAATMADMAGIQTQPYLGGEEGCMLVAGMDSGSWIRVNGVDFGTKGAREFSVTLQSSTGGGKLYLYLDGLEDGICIGCVDIPKGSVEYFTRTTELDRSLIGVHDLYFWFDGSGYKMKDWVFAG